MLPWRIFSRRNYSKSCIGCVRCSNRTVFQYDYCCWRSARFPDDAQEQPGMLETWQWEEILETGVQIAIGQQAVLEEVMILPMVAYRRWLETEA